MPKTAIEKQIENFMIEFTFASNRIEGGTLTLAETRQVLQDDRAPANKPLSDVIEAKKHKSLFYAMINHGGDITQDLIVRWHYLLFEDTKKDIAGQIRNYKVGIAGSGVKLPDPAEIQPLLDDFFRWYNRNRNDMHPVELAALVHYKFVRIHPFGDGNGRISRMLMNFILQKNGYPMWNILPREKASYYQALSSSDREQEEYCQYARRFVLYMTRRYVRLYR
jgi:Fic family protein